MRLRNKIRSHSIGGKVLAWIVDWLTGRRQKVGIKGRFSGWLLVVFCRDRCWVRYFSRYVFVFWMREFVARFAGDTKIDGGADSVEARSLEKD